MEDAAQTTKPTGTMEDAAKSYTTTQEIKNILNSGRDACRTLKAKRKREAPQKPEEKRAEEKSAETVTLHDLDRIHEMLVSADLKSVNKKMKPN